MNKTINFFGRTLVACKTNLHTHTTLSDGKYTPEEIIYLYSKENYDALCLTDHNKTNPVSEYDGKGMTLLSGIEMHPMGPRGIKWHLLAVGVPEEFTYDTDGTGQEAIDAALSANAAVFCAHPYWCGFTSNEVAFLNGICGIEVFNSSCIKIGREYSMQCFDELLDAGKRYTAIAVDDTHYNYNLFRGYTVIAAENKSKESLITALKRGDFYASQGPEFYSINIENNVLKAEFSPVTKAIAMRRRSAGTCFTMPDFEGPGSGTKEITGLELDLSEFSNTYVRLQLCDASGRMAWSNPVFID